MKYYLLAACIFFFASCSNTTYYIVRHAEKAIPTAGMGSDVPLSDAGKQRAENLKGILLNKNVAFIYSTNTIRTITTAKPLSDAINVPVVIYNSQKDSLPVFIEQLRKRKSNKNVLVVGHSNTVDDLVNLLMKQTLLSDLKDIEYDNLFIVNRKGKKYFFKNEKY